MAEQHPLTDEIIENICRTPSFCFEDVSEVLPVFTSHDMRAATDWQLEQVIEWLKDNLGSSMFLQLVEDNVLGESGTEVNVDYVIQHLREEMRPL